MLPEEEQKRPASEESGFDPNMNKPIAEIIVESCPGIPERDAALIARSIERKFGIEYVEQIKDKETVYKIFKKETHPLLEQSVVGPVVPAIMSFLSFVEE